MGDQRWLEGQGYMKMDLIRLLLFLFQKHDEILDSVASLGVGNANKRQVCVVCVCHV